TEAGGGGGAGADGSAGGAAAAGDHGGGAVDLQPRDGGAQGPGAGFADVVEGGDEDLGVVGQAVVAAAVAHAELEFVDGSRDGGGRGVLSLHRAGEGDDGDGGGENRPGGAGGKGKVVLHGS